MKTLTYFHAASTDRTETRGPTWKSWALAAAALGIACLSTGCMAYPGGFSAGYYEPDYSSYYGDYGYSGAPFGDFGGFYGGDIIVGGVHHHGYYGGHHFGHDFHGGFGGGHGWHGGGGGHHH